MGAMEKTCSVTAIWTPVEQLLVVGYSILTGSIQAPIQKVPDSLIDTGLLSIEIPPGNRIGTVLVDSCRSAMLIVESLER